MSPWLCAAGITALALVPCAVRALSGPPIMRLVGLEMGAMVATILLLLLAQGFARPAFYDLALTLGLFSFGGGLVFARFLERWL